MSAMTFSGPSTCTVVSRPAWCQKSMYDSPRSSRPETADFDFDAILSIHPMVGVLSLSVPSATCLIVAALSMMIPTANTSAASSRSELVIVPVGLSSETTSLAMSGGKASLHTIGCMSCNNENQIPPLPSAAASWYPIYCGMSGTNSRTWVGRDPRRWMREQMSLIVDLTSFPNVIDFAVVLSSLLRG